MNLQEFLQSVHGGKLSVDDIGRGMHKCFKNASELVEDAELIIKQRPARALSLAVLAIEEIAKVILLANAAARAVAGPISWKEIQEDLNLRSHKVKQAVFAAYGKAILDKLSYLSEKDTWYNQEVPSGIGPLLDYMKQLGFYVDVAHGQFISPAEFGTDNKEWAEWLISIAKERLASFEKLHGTEEKSIKVARKAAELVTLVSNINDDDLLKERIHEFVKNNLQRT